MSAVALWSDTAELEQRAAEVRKATRYKEFEVATHALRTLTRGVEPLWSAGPEEAKDIFRHLAALLNEPPKVGWLKQQHLKLRVISDILRLGPEQITRRVAAFENARREFVSAVFAANERDDPKLQAVIAESIASSLNDPSRVQVKSKEDLDEWFKRLPS